MFVRLFETEEPFELIEPFEAFEAENSNRRHPPVDGGMPPIYKAFCSSASSFSRLMSLSLMVLCSDLS